MTHFNDCNKFYHISENYKHICEKINKTMLISGRTDEVRLMAVTKTVPISLVNHSASLGIKLIGENRVQEFVEKYPEYDKNFEIHFIGGLQNNKVKYIISKVTMIESVNSIKLAEEINKRALATGIKMDILLEVNIAFEKSKSGIEPDKIPEMISTLIELPAIRVRGLMAIPPPLDNGGNEKHFENMRKLYSDTLAILKSENKIVFDTLSMGMSYDFEMAIKHGSNIIRLGRALFGERNVN